MNNNHCQPCEKANHWDFSFAVLAIFLTGFAVYFLGWGVLKYLIWPWLFLIISWVMKYFLNKK
ncbi:MAG: hypothetical protein MRERC_5c020 [Mycoplasmataceae bacterium RC_NB112A]|nr:MAG: hypothetical protein MRERC_5c020 [Mycoplasmataceae bacterium RC_NB112A]